MTTAKAFLATQYVAGHPDWAARQLETYPPERAAAFLQERPADVCAAVLSAMHPEQAAACVNALAREAAVTAIGEMSFRQTTVILRRLARAEREALLDALPPRVSRRLKRSLVYGEGTAGALAHPDVAVASHELTVGEVRKRVSKLAAEGPYVYLIDRDHRLVGVTSPRELRSADQDAPVTAVMKRQVRSLLAHLEFGNLATSAAWAEWDVLPVVSSGGVLLGTISHRTLRQVGARPAQRSTGALDTVMEISESYWTAWATLLLSMGQTTNPRTPAATVAEE